MFAKTIIDSDAFLDMPVTSQLLYFHLSMRADDDGFVNKPKSIMRMCSCKDDDLKLLFAKKFLIPFESGVVVIKHWKIHNYIRKDTYTETKYKEEKSLLGFDENNAYRLSETVPSLPRDEAVTGTGTQVREGKDRIGKDRIGEGGSNNTDCETDIFLEIASLFNSLCPSLPSVKTITDNRKQTLSEALKVFTLDDFKEVFEKAKNSPFLNGSNKRNWKASFDWLIDPSNMIKVLEGTYDDEKAKKAKKAGFDFDFEDIYEKPEPKTAADDDSIRERMEALKQKLSQD